MQPEDATRRLAELRRDIDDIDHTLFSLVARRMNLAADIGAIKRAQGMPVGDPVREARLKERLKEHLADVLAPWHVDQLARLLIAISREIQGENSDAAESR